MFRKLFLKKYKLKEQRKNIEKFFLDLNLNIYNKEFRDKIGIIKNIILNKLTEEEFLKLEINSNNLSFTSQELSYKLSINNNIIESVIKIKEENREILEIEKYIQKGDEKNLEIILESSKEETILNNKFIERRKSSITKLFNNYVEMYNESTNENERYTYKNRKKTYLPTDYLYNVKEIIKIIRTKNNNLIKSHQMTYYNEEMEQNSKINYYKGKGISDDYFSIPLNGEYIPMSEKECNKFIDGETTEDELFKNFESAKIFQKYLCKRFDNYIKYIYN